MKIYVNLSPNSDQFLKLRSLHEVFAELCNRIVPYVLESKSFNRVAMHHLVYHQLRKEFPNMGSQMVCNSIYSVCRAYKALSTHSSFVRTNGNAEKIWPKIFFTSTAPVYFDRHTLSYKNNSLSLYTLDGRMKFQIFLGDDQREILETKKMREIILCTGLDKAVLTFSFHDDSEPIVEGELLDEFKFSENIVLMDDDSVIVKKIA